MEQLEAVYTPNQIIMDFEEMVRQGVDAVEIVDWGAVSEAFLLWDSNSLILPARCISGTCIYETQNTKGRTNTTFGSSEWSYIEEECVAKESSMILLDLRRSRTHSL